MSVFTGEEFERPLLHWLSADYFINEINYAMNKDNYDPEEYLDDEYEIEQAIEFETEFAEEQCKAMVLERINNRYKIIYNLFSKLEYSLPCHYFAWWGAFDVYSKLKEIAKERNLSKKFDNLFDINKWRGGPNRPYQHPEEQNRIEEMKNKKNEKKRKITHYYESKKKKK